MATVNLIKAASRARAGKGAARAERRAGRVPGIIYGDGKPPVPISLDHKDLSQRIYAGHFLTTIHDVEVDGVKHRVIPRDFQLDVVRDQGPAELIRQVRAAEDSDPDCARWPRLKARDEATIVYWRQDLSPGLS